MAILYRSAYLKINSIVLKASYKDSVNDILTTLVIVIGLYFGDLFNISIDGYLGLGLSICIFISGIKLVKESINKLMSDTIYEDVQNIDEFTLKTKELYDKALIEKQKRINNITLIYSNFMNEHYKVLRDLEEC